MKAFTGVHDVDRAVLHGLWQSQGGDVRGLRQVRQRTWLESPGFGGFTEILYGQIGAGTAVASHTEISAFRECVPVSFSTMWFNPFTLV